MLNDGGVRELAYVVTVDDVQPLPGYDKVEYARANGWWCVVGKGMRPGDLAVYFEIDSLLPKDDERFAFLEKRNYRIKTQKMCKVLSQGLLMPLSAFPELSECVAGDFVTRKLGVTYYEPQDQFRKSNPKPGDKYKKMAARHPKLFQKPLFRWLMGKMWGKKLLFVFFGKKKPARGWPAFCVKTDEERIQNMPFILKNKEPWTATEKIDGTSTTIAVERKKKLFGYKYESYVCSRNVCFENEDETAWYDSNVYYEMAKKYDIVSKLKKYLDNNKDCDWAYIQGETYGAGIQKRTYSKDEHDFVVFNFVTSRDGRWPTKDMCSQMKLMGIPHVPVVDEAFILPDTVEELLEYATGASVIDGLPREGIVFRDMEGKQSFKAVSNEYLMKYHG